MQKKEKLEQKKNVRYKAFLAKNLIIENVCAVGRRYIFANEQLFSIISLAKWRNRWPNKKKIFIELKPVHSSQLRDEK